MSKNKNLLLISKEKLDQEFAAQVASKCGLSLVSVPTAEEGVGVLDQDGAALVFAECRDETQYEELELAIQDRLGLFSDKINPNHFHFLVPNERNIGKLKYTFESPILGNLVFRDQRKISDLVERYSTICKGILGSSPFKLTSYLASTAESQRVEIKTLKQKPDVLQGVKDFLLRVGLHSRIACLATSSADELIMNAFFEAPVDDLGKPVGRTLLRGGSITTKIKPVSLEVAFDGNTAGISVSDEYGSLNKSKLLAGVVSLFPDSKKKKKAISVGQPMGLSMLVRQGANLAFICDPTNNTSAMAFFPVTQAFVDFRLSSRFVVTQFLLR